MTGLKMAGLSMRIELIPPAEIDAIGHDERGVLRSFQSEPFLVRPQKISVMLLPAAIRMGQKSKTKQQTR